ncbi:MAG: efflux RND transporter permease subunit, partial [Myxococcota bacterium]|nr:efflux RND transporter permease subunit [Myxococcota bacterium]
ELGPIRSTLPPGTTVTETPAPAGASPSPPDLLVSVRGADGSNVGIAAEQIERELRTSHAGVAIERTPAPTPQLTVIVDRDRAAVLAVDVAAVHATLAVVQGGLPVGTVTAGAHRRDIVVRLAGEGGSHPEALGQLQIRSRHGELVPIATVATIRSELAIEIRRLDGLREITLGIGTAGQSVASVRGRLVELMGRLPIGTQAIITP